jgi:proline iminopeptidase
MNLQNSHKYSLGLIGDMKTLKQQRSKPFRTGHLPVTDGHSIYFEEHGNPEGRPVTYLHGGPGGGLERAFTRFFDLKKWRLILFDQRGCGKSTPFASLHHNTTWDLVADMEALRTHLGLTKWSLVGGSWGTTLALAYAETHPIRVTCILLRGVCLMEPYEYRWLYESTGSANVFPEQWAKFVEPISPSVRNKSANTIMRAYKHLLTSKNTATRQRAANHWWNWEAAVSFLEPHADNTGPKAAESLAILENHYFLHNAWIKPGQLLANAYKLKGIPVTIIHGRYDLVCPFKSAWALHKALPSSKLIAMPRSGHAASEVETERVIKREIRALL